MKKTLMHDTGTTPATGLRFAVREQAFLAPNPAAQGTGLSFAGSAATAVAAAAQAAVAGVRSTDLPGSLSRGAPV